MTLANIAFGFLGMVSAAEHHFERACVLFFCAAVCDLMDGRLARMLNASSKFGSELDSLSDVVSFGIGPGFLIYLSALHGLGAVGIAISVAYVLCGALRLARFNVGTGPLSDITFVGIPIPVAAGYILSLVMVRDSLPSWGVAVGTGLAALGMVSTLKVPKFRKGSGLPVAMLVVGLGLFVFFLARPSALTWHLWNGWNFVMVGANYIVLSKRGHLSPTPDPANQQPHPGA